MLPRFIPSVLVVLIMIFFSCDSGADEVAVTCDPSAGENILWSLEGQPNLCLTGEVKSHQIFIDDGSDTQLEEMVIEVVDKIGNVIWILTMYTYDPDVENRLDSRTIFEEGKEVVYAYGRAGNAGGGDASVTFSTIDRVNKVVSGTFSGTALIRIRDGGIPELGTVTGTFTQLAY